MSSGLRPALGGEGRRENTQTESKTRRLLAEMVLSAVRKNPQQPAQTRGSRQKKANPEGLVFPLLVVYCGPGFKLALTTGEKIFGCLSPVCGDCSFRIVELLLCDRGNHRKFWSSGLNKLLHVDICVKFQR